MLTSVVLETSVHSLQCAGVLGCPDPHQHYCWNSLVENFIQYILIKFFTLQIPPLFLPAQLHILYLLRKT